MKRNAKKRTVLVVLWLAGSAGRKQLTGILQYVNAGHPWSIRLITDPKDFTDEAIRQAETDGVHGFLVHANAQVGTALAASTVPTVLLDFPPLALRSRKNAIALILDGDEQIGRTAADYFLRLGNFASFAFVPDEQNRGWSRLRERGYKTTLDEHGRPCQVYGRGKGNLSDWLKTLTRPAAVFTAYDLRAQETIEACKTAKLSIPGQVAVLGVDNDELICDYTTPSISSIRIDHETLGAEAAKLLDRMMRTPSAASPKPVFMSAGVVVERESTAPTPPAAHLVARALAYIHAHASECISVSDVVRHLGISRRLADRRFGAATGTSIRRAIEDRRLALVKERLASTRLPIDKISRLCGYANAQRLKYVFKARFGMPMTTWRAREQADRRQP